MFSAAVQLLDASGRRAKERSRHLPRLLPVTELLNYRFLRCRTLKLKSITVRDVDLSIDDVSRLRQAWCATLIQAAEPLPNIHAQRGGTCTDLDEIVFQEGDNSSDDVRLVFAGKDLQKGRPLSGYGVGSDSTVHVLGRLRGGAQLGKVVKGRSQVRQQLDLIC